MGFTADAIDLDGYLKTEYRPDAEYIDGHLKEKPVIGFEHGVIQGLLATWFRQHRKQWGIQVAVGTRTQVEVARVRLSDVVVVRKGEGAVGALTKPPLIAIEVLSPTDSYADLRAMGVENIWLLDPARRTAEVWTGTHWQPVEGNQLQTVNSPVFLDLEWLWAEMDD